MNQRTRRTEEERRRKSDDASEVATGHGDPRDEAVRLAGEIDSAIDTVLSGDSERYLEATEQLGGE
jgi:hypothetical protein